VLLFPRTCQLCSYHPPVRQQRRAHRRRHRRRGAQPCLLQFRSPLRPWLLPGEPPVCRHRHRPLALLRRPRGVHRWQQEGPRWARSGECWRGKLGRGGAPGLGAADESSGHARTLERCHGYALRMLWVGEQPYTEAWQVTPWFTQGAQGYEEASVEGTGSTRYLLFVCASRSHCLPAAQGPGLDTPHHRTCTARVRRNAAPETCTVQKGATRFAAAERLGLCVHCTAPRGARCPSNEALKLADPVAERVWQRRELLAQVIEGNRELPGGIGRNPGNVAAIGHWHLSI